MEILAPAGSLEKLKYAVVYGADAVYAAGKDFGLRAKAANLSNQELIEAVEFCHSHQRKLYVPVNIFAHNRDIDKLTEHLKFLQEIQVDAVIVSDPGVFSLVRENAPNLSIHLSTQANTTSYKSAEFWYNQGVERIILARELSFNEIIEIKKKVPGLELEIFIHGAMCISYSGRCLISAFLNNRSANQGLCTHPCRWQFSLCEESRPGQYFPIEEDKRGTYILNSKDLCLFEELNKITVAGIDGIKIEGRMKSLYYVANTVRIYRAAIDATNQAAADQQVASHIDWSLLREELNKVSHRQWTKGFFYGRDNDSQSYNNSTYQRDYQFLGEIVKVFDLSQSPLKGIRTSIDKDADDKVVVEVNVRAKFEPGDEIEFIFPDYRHDKQITVTQIYDLENNVIGQSNPNQSVRLIVSGHFPLAGIARKRIASPSRNHADDHI